MAPQDVRQRRHGAQGDPGVERHGRRLRHGVVRERTARAAGATRQAPPPPHAQGGRPNHGSFVQIWLATRRPDPLRCTAANRAVACLVPLGCSCLSIYPTLVSPAPRTQRKPALRPRRTRPRSPLPVCSGTRRGPARLRPSTHRHGPVRVEGPHARGGAGAARRRRQEDNPVRTCPGPAPPRSMRTGDWVIGRRLALAPTQRGDDTGVRAVGVIEARGVLRSRPGRGAVRGRDGSRPRRSTR